MPVIEDDDLNTSAMPHSAQQHLAAGRVADCVSQHIHQNLTKPDRIGPHRQFRLNGDLQPNPMTQRQPVHLVHRIQCFSFHVQQR